MFDIESLLMAGALLVVGFVVGFVAAHDYMRRR